VAPCYVHIFHKLLRDAYQANSKTVLTAAAFYLHLDARLKDLHVPGRTGVYVKCPVQSVGPSDQVFALAPQIVIVQLVFVATNYENRAVKL